MTIKKDMSDIKHLNRLQCKRMLQIYFRPLGTIAVCAMMTIASVVLFVLTIVFSPNNKNLSNIIMAVTTGVAASALVTGFSEAVKIKKETLKEILG